MTNAEFARMLRQNNEDFEDALKGERRSDVLLELAAAIRELSETIRATSIYSVPVEELQKAAEPLTEDEKRECWEHLERLKKKAEEPPTKKAGPPPGDEEFSEISDEIKRHAAAAIREALVEQLKTIEPPPSVRSSFGPICELPDGIVDKRKAPS